MEKFEEKNAISGTDVEFALEEFGRTRERFTDLQIENILRNGDLSIRVAERGFNLIVSLTSLAVAFITIVVPLTDNKIFNYPFVIILFFRLSFVYFFACALIGITYTLWIVYKDGKDIKERAEWEAGHLQKISEATNDIYNKLRKEEIVTENDLLIAVNQKTLMDQEAKDMQKAANTNPSARVLNLLHKLFFSFFFLGFACLFITLWSNSI